LLCRASSLGIYFGSPKARADEASFRNRATEILDYLGLGAVKALQARNLPHGHLRALGIAVAMAAEPKLLLLDEPFSGMNLEETDTAVEMVRGIRDRGVTIVLIEHDMSAVMRISDKINVSLNLQKSEIVALIGRTAPERLRRSGPSAVWPSLRPAKFGSTANASTGWTRLPSSHSASQWCRKAVMFIPLCP
jgi:ABC-type nitrate/sulfonate/bicarbonate transport system ATPase subunit